MKKLNFRKWLNERNVDTHLFWKNCKRCYAEPDEEYRKEAPKRKHLKEKGPGLWIEEAFVHHYSLQTNIRWDLLSEEWKQYVLEAQYRDVKIVFGF